MKLGKATDVTNTVNHIQFLLSSLKITTKFYSSSATSTEKMHENKLVFSNKQKLFKEDICGKSIFKKSKITFVSIFD